MHPLSASTGAADVEGNGLLVNRAPAAAADEKGRLIFDESPLPMLVHEQATTRCVAANAAAIALHGYAREELLALRLFDVQSADDEAATTQPLASTTDAPRPRIFRHRKKDGSYLDVEVAPQQLVFRGVPACLAIVRDVTERTREDAFAAAQQRVLEMIATGEAQPAILQAIAKMCEDESPEVICSIEVLPLDPASARRAPSPSSSVPLPTRCGSPPAP